MVQGGGASELKDLLIDIALVYYSSSLFAKLELGFFGGDAFFVGFPDDFCQFFCHLETLIREKNWRANERPARIF